MRGGRAFLAALLLLVPAVAAAADVAAKIIARPLAGFSVSTAGSGRGSWLCASGAAGAGLRASSKREAWGVEAWDMRPENGTIRDRPI